MIVATEVGLKNLGKLQVAMGGDIAKWESTGLSKEIG